MTLSQEEARQYATYCIREHNAEYEFLTLAENEDLGHLEEDDLRLIFDEMYAAQLTIEWEAVLNG